MSLEHAICDAVECVQYASAMHYEAEAAKKDASDELQAKKAAVQTALRQLMEEVEA